MVRTHTDDLREPMLECWNRVGQPMIPATFLILVKTLPRIALVALLFAALAVGTESMLVSPQH